MKRSLQIVGLIATSAVFGVAGYMFPIDRVGLNLGDVASSPQSQMSNTPEHSLVVSSAKQNSNESFKAQSQSLQIVKLNALELSKNLYNVEILVTGNDTEELECSVVSEVTGAVIATEVARPNVVCMIPRVSSAEDDSYKLVVKTNGANPQTVEQHISGIVHAVAVAPKNIKAYIAERKPKEPNKVSRTVTVSAELESGDMECIIRNVKTNAEVKKQMMTNGKTTFSVPPIDGGEYLIVVRNVATGDEASITKKGFDKIAKWSVSDIESQFNGSDQRDKFLRHHFSLDKLQISCAPGSEVVSSLDELLEVKANGGTVRVVDTPKYDKYNRITNLTVSVLY